MKTCILLLSGFVGMCMGAHGREIKSADGGKTIQAEFVRYDIRTGNVTLQVEGGRNMVVPASRFSKNDIAYFIEQQKTVEQKDAISVDVDEQSDNVSSKRGKLLYKIKNSKFKFSISNSSGFEFKDLKVNHWVVVERGSGGSKSVQVLQGTKVFPSLPAKGRAVAEGPSVELTQGAVSKDTMGCPKVAARAASIGRDRVLGSKVQIVDSTGREILSHKNPDNIDSHLSSATRPKG